MNMYSYMFYNTKTKVPLILITSELTIKQELQFLETIKLNQYTQERQIVIECVKFITIS